MNDKKAACRMNDEVKIVEKRSDGELSKCRMNGEKKKYATGMNKKKKKKGNNKLAWIRCVWGMSDKKSYLWNEWKKARKREKKYEE